MEYKWFYISGALIAIAAFTGITAEKYTINQCKVSYISSNKTADEILKICGK